MSTDSFLDVSPTLMLLLNLCLAWLMVRRDARNAQSDRIGTTTLPPGLDRAGHGRRLGTFVVDYAAFVLLCKLLAALIGFAVGFTLVMLGVIAIGQAPRVLLGVVAGAVFFAVYIAIYFGYYLFFEGIWARTPGKWLFGTMVVREDGRRPSFKQILVRTACRCIPFEPLSFFGAVGWHDSIPKTRVVRASRLRGPVT